VVPVDEPSETVPAAVDLAGAPRWRGQPGRLEVHYLTATDPASGTGLWLHHEVVAPTAGAAYAHGWLALFPPDERPAYERFGPVPAAPVRAADDTGDWFRTGDVTLTPTTATGRAGGLEWDLAWSADAAPVWTFPRWAWQRRVLPAAQVVPIPATPITGTVAGRRYDGTAALAHIDGHGNAQRWVWLHAHLGDGDVLEIVAATARRPGMRLLPMLPLVQLRVDGRDWPRDPLAAAPLLRAKAQPHRFAVSGIVGTRRLRVAAGLPADRCVTLDYADPDGAPAVCVNTERADVRVAVDRLGPTGWRRERSWRLDGTGHAEIGTRP
jgi:hypothetical protein